MAPTGAASQTVPVGPWAEQAAGYVRWTFASPWSIAALAVVVITAVKVAPGLARRFGWDAIGTAVMLLGVGLALIPTVVARLNRPLDFDPVAVPPCDGPVAQSWLNPDQVLNVALLLPAAAGAVWATRRVVAGVGLTALLAVGIERLQSATGLGVCEQQDMLGYLAGGIGGAAVVGLLLRLELTAAAPPPVGMSSDRPVERGPERRW